MPLISPRGVGFHSIKHLNNRFNANRETERSEVISIDDIDVPAWQRQIVWNNEEMGLLAFSIINNYPIGMIILWKKPDAIRVPIDGRQRLTAIRRFYEGHVAIPSLPLIPTNFHNKKYKLLEGDTERGYSELDIHHKEVFDDYELSMVQYEEINEALAMDIFVMLQGGKSLTKTEVRAALGGELCEFVTNLTSPITISDDADDSDEPPSKHSFFKDLNNNFPNRRKAHRNVCDILLHEILYQNQDKHWTSLETMYRDKMRGFTETQKTNFTTILGKFHRAVMTNVENEKVILPQLRGAHFILTVFKAWHDLYEQYNIPAEFNFAQTIADFETQRASNPDDIPWINFTAALSNAGYSKNRIITRHDILMAKLLNNCPSATTKQRDIRTFTIAQKIAIWEKADRQCEWLEDNERCSETFPNPRDADADHIVKWSDDGPTTIENGRLLCRKHNRSRK